jgi:hypothetical protein
VVDGLCHTAMSLEAWSVAGGYAIAVCALVMGCHPRRAARVSAQAQNSHGRQDRWSRWLP